jgi:hypothetical protein
MEYMNNITATMTYTKAFSKTTTFLGLKIDPAICRIKIKLNV